MAGRCLLDRYLLPVSAWQDRPLWTFSTHDLRVRDILDVYVRIHAYSGEDEHRFRSNVKT